MSLRRVVLVPDPIIVKVAWIVVHFPPASTLQDKHPASLLGQTTRCDGPTSFLGQVGVEPNPVVRLHFRPKRALQTNAEPHTLLSG